MTAVACALEAGPGFFMGSPADWFYGMDSWPMLFAIFCQQTLSTVSYCMKRLRWILGSSIPHSTGFRLLVTPPAPPHLKHDNQKHHSRTARARSPSIPYPSLTTTTGAPVSRILAELRQPETQGALESTAPARIASQCFLPKA